jgi:DNA-binding transcriptional MerR regulator
VPQHVLRFWEGKFAQVKPMKRAGGRRFYRPEDMALLRGVRAFLQEDGYTIKGVQKLLRDHGVGFVRRRGEGEIAPAAPAPSRAATPAPAPEPGPLFAAVAAVASPEASPLRRILVRLEAAKAQLDAVLPG